MAINLIDLTHQEQIALYYLVDGIIRDIQADKTGDYDCIVACLPVYVAIRDKYLAYFESLGVPVPATPSIQ